MAKIITSIILICAGAITLGIWEAGSHGHVMFRPWMTEDWILSAIVLVCFGVPLYFLARWALKKL